MNQDLECPHCGHWDEASPDYYIGADQFSEYEHKCSNPQCGKTYLFTVDFRTKAKEGIEVQRDELLIKLKNVMSWIDNWNPNFEDDPAWPADRDAALAAIVKAESGAQS